MGIEENEAAIGRFLSPRVFFGGADHHNVVDEVFDSKVVWLNPGNEEELSRGTEVIDDIKNELTSYVGEEGEREITILEQIAEGDSVATRYRLELPWGVYIGVTFSRFVDGMIREYRVVGGNKDMLGVRITDSGRSDRPDTKNATVENNIMEGDIVKLGTGVSASADNIMLR